MEIKNFCDEYEFLSNFYETPVKYKYTFGSSEAAYQAQKSANPADVTKFTKYTAGKSKRMGRKVELRADWEEVKISVMRDIVFAKFFQHPELAKRLLETGDATLIEGNDWHDTFWGVDAATGEGQNNLGKILMEVRAELRAPEIRLLRGENVLLTRFEAPELVIFDWFPLQTTFQWSQPDGDDIELKFERLYKIDGGGDDFDGIEDCIWYFHGRLFADLNFLLGDELKTLYKDYDAVQKIKAYNDGKKFFYQASKIPTFDEFDSEWDNVNEFVIFRDDKGVNLLRSQHGWKIPSILIYTGLKNSPPALEKILAQLD